METTISEGMNRVERMKNEINRIENSIMNTTKNNIEVGIYIIYLYIKRCKIVIKDRLRILLVVISGNFKIYYFLELLSATN